MGGPGGNREATKMLMVRFVMLDAGNICKSAMAAAAACSQSEARPPVHAHTWPGAVVDCPQCCTAAAAVLSVSNVVRQIRRVRWAEVCQLRLLPAWLLLLRRGGGARKLGYQSYGRSPLLYNKLKFVPYEYEYCY